MTDRQVSEGAKALRPRHDPACEERAFDGCDCGLTQLVNDRSALLSAVEGIRSDRLGVIIHLAQRHVRQDAERGWLT